MVHRNGTRFAKLLDSNLEWKNDARLLIVHTCTMADYGKIRILSLDREARLVVRFTLPRLSGVSVCSLKTEIFFLRIMAPAYVWTYALLFFTLQRECLAGTVVASSKSWFEEVPPAQVAIEVFAKMNAFHDDPSPVKVDLGAGAFKTEEGKRWVLPGTVGD